MTSDRPPNVCGVTHVVVAWPPDEAAARRAHDAFQDHQGVLDEREYAACFARHRDLWLKVVRAAVTSPGPDL